MPYAFMQDVPANEEMYRQIRADLGAGTPDGLVAHLVVEHGAGLRYIDVWDTRADWERFRDERAEPAVTAFLAKLGIPHDHSLVTFTELDLVDTWFGERHDLTRRRRAPGDNGPMETTRVDRWLWSVRLYKTRSAATEACDGGHVRVNGAAAKPTTRVKVGDHVEAWIGRQRRVEVAQVIDKRVGAPAAAACLIDHSPPPPAADLVPALSVRDRGAGRPTKRDRRELDRLRRG